MTFKELAKELRTARLAKKWRPRDIARKTKIQYEYIKKMESGDFQFLPEPVIRGFIRSYARDVGLDQNLMVAKYEQAKLAEISSEYPQEEEKVSPEKMPPKASAKKPEPRGKSTAGLNQVDSKSGLKPKRTAEEEKAQKESSRITKRGVSKPTSAKIPPLQKKQQASRQSMKWLGEYRGEIILGVMLSLIVAAILYVYFGKAKFLSVEAQKPVKKISVFEARKEILEKEQQPPQIKPIRPPEKATLRIVAAETTWVRLVKDEADTSEYIFVPGVEHTFEAKNSIELKAGRADGLLMWVNQDSIGKLGSASQIVRRLVITPEGIQEKILRSPLKSRAARDSSAGL